MTSAIRWPFGVSASSVSGGQIGHWPMIDQPLHLEGENEQSGMGQLPFILKRFHSTLAKFQNIGGYFVRPKHVGLGLFGNKNLAIVAKIE